MKLKNQKLLRKQVVLNHNGYNMSKLKLSEIELKIRLEIEVKTSNNTINLVTSIDKEKVTELVYDLQEKALRNELIELGWTPPTDNTGADKER